MAKKKLWIQAAGIKKGALHRQLGIPQGQKIPKSTLQSAAKQGGTLAKRANLALTLGKMRGSSLSSYAPKKRGK